MNLHLLSQIAPGVAVQTRFIPEHGHFDTVILGGEHAGTTWSEDTWEQAEDAHHQIVMAVASGAYLPAGAHL